MLGRCLGRLSTRHEACSNGIGAVDVEYGDGIPQKLRRDGTLASGGEERETGVRSLERKIEARRGHLVKAQQSTCILISQSARRASSLLF